ncbi:MAG TPA: MBL fold metallo-hydrolase [Vicinamibacterales bacterium]|nr:MBL fold metallo-hydrolase [Vicinamibacterales bacterium]
MKLDRRAFFVLTSVGAAGLLAPRRIFARAAPQQPVSAPPKFEDVRRNVGVFTMRGGTIGWLVTRDAVAVVDSQYADTAQACIDGLKQKAPNRGIDMLFNTHHHGDHTGGNGVFRPVVKKIVAHRNVPDLMRKALSASSAPPAAAPAIPDAIFETAWSQDFGDEKMTARYDGPGHTGGDAIVHFERAHVVHMGDLLFHERHPRVDRPAGASMQNWMKILERVTAAMPADTIYIAGHSRDGLPVTTDRKAVLRFRDYLDAALTFARKGIAAGQSKEAIAAATLLPGFESYQGSGTALTLGGVLTAAFEELSAK